MRTTRNFALRWVCEYVCVVTEREWYGSGGGDFSVPHTEIETETETTTHTDTHIDTDTDADTDTDTDTHTQTLTHPICWRVRVRC